MPFIQSKASGMGGEVTSQAAVPCTPIKVEVSSNKDESRTVDLLGGFIRLEYRESILSDSVKAVYVFADAGDAIDGKSTLEGLPLIGTEDIKLEFEDNNENKFKVDLNVNKVTPLIEDVQKSMVALSLVSEEYIRNEQGSAGVKIRYDGKISDHIKKILEDNLKTEKELDIEETANNYNFLGNGRKPYYIMNWLSKASIPQKDGKEGDSAGFLFYETAEGYHFKSIDTLFAQEKKRSFIYNQTPDGEKGIPAGYDGKILEYGTDNLIDAQQKLRMGAFQTKLIVFDPFNCYYETFDQTAKETEEGTTLAGKELPQLNEKKFEFNDKKNATRTTYMLLDTGTLPTGDTDEQISKNELQNFKSKTVMNQSIRRYNQIYTASVTITLAADFTLHAGDAIFVDAPELKADVDDEVNKETGGLYIISDLCHYITPQESYTKVNLVRDSFGRKGNHTKR